MCYYSTRLGMSLVIVMIMVSTRLRLRLVIAIIVPTMWRVRWGKGMGTTMRSFVMRCVIVGQDLTWLQFETTHL